jgi:F-box and WD-40 domain protein CDC4
MSSGQGVHSSDDPKFFRRIHVVCMMNQESVDPTHFSFAAHGQVITCLIFSHGRIISASDDHEIHVYSPITGEQLLSLDGHEGGVWALAADGDTLASGSTDRTVRI